MKSDLEKRTNWYFFGGLALIALCINGLFWGHLSPHGSQPDSTDTPVPSRPLANAGSRQADPSVASTVDPSVAAREAAQAAEARKQYLARYLNSEIQRKSGMKLVAVLAATEAGKISRDVSQALSTRFKTSDSEIVGTFFKPELVSDGLLEQLFAESTQLRQKLELDKALDGLILARLGVEYVNNPSLENVTTANMSLKVAVQALREDGGSKTWTLTASGAGFDRNAARAMAEERILKAISADTKMSLAAVLTAK